MRLLIFLRIQNYYIENKTFGDRSASEDWRGVLFLQPKPDSSSTGSN